MTEATLETNELDIDNVEVLKTFTYESAELKRLLLEFGDESLLLEFNPYDQEILRQIVSIEEKVEKSGIRKGKHDMKSFTQVLTAFDDFFQAVFNQENAIQWITRRNGGKGLGRLKPLLDVIDFVKDEVNKAFAEEEELLKALKETEKSNLVKLATDTAKEI
jgi:hypothetical protein